jgi:hypothetical protein
VALREQLYAGASDIGPPCSLLRVGAVSGQSRSVELGVVPELAATVSVNGPKEGLAERGYTIAA